MIWWWFDDSNVVKNVWQTDRRMDGRTGRTIDRVGHGWKGLIPGAKLIPWWRHQMETFSALLALCAGNSPVPVPVNSPHKSQWRRGLMFSFISARINDWVNNLEAGDLRRHRGHYDVNVMLKNNYRPIFTSSAQTCPRKSLSPCAQSALCLVFTPNDAPLLL